MKHPNEIEWIDGDLPDVHTVPKNCLVLAWIVTDTTLGNPVGHPQPPLTDYEGELRRISMCSPYENELNPLRWVDGSYMPIGYHEKVTHWAWIIKGEKDQ